MRATVSMNSNLKCLAKATAIALLWTVTATSADEGMWMPGRLRKWARPCARMGSRSIPPSWAVWTLTRSTRSYHWADAPPRSSDHKGWSQPIITACSNPSNTTARRARTISQTAFWRRALGEELPPAPGSRIYVIEDMRDVTAEMLKGDAKFVHLNQSDRKITRARTFRT